ncbi:MAG: hypothetical protein ACE15B_23395 [Bryobacteraceae bacterium]
MTAAQAAVLLVAFGTSARCESSVKTAAPEYSAGSIAHSATNTAGPFAPNIPISIYGTDLSWEQKTAAGEARLPERLGGVQVLANRTPAPLYFVSPKQVNALIPASAVEGDMEIVVVREGTHGPAVKLKLETVAPGLYQSGEFAVAIHADWTLITPEKPARPGEAIVLYAAGLGRTVVRFGDFDFAPAGLGADALALQNRKSVRVVVGGAPVEPFWAGAAPGFAGLYQVNVVLPETLAAKPEIRISVGDAISPATFLPAAALNQ